MFPFSFAVSFYFNQIIISFQVPEESNKFTKCGLVLDWVFRIVFLILIVIIVGGYFAMCTIVG